MMQIEDLRLGAALLRESSLSAAARSVGVTAGPVDEAYELLLKFDRLREGLRINQFPGGSGGFSAAVTLARWQLGKASEPDGAGPDRLAG